jgi:hypothetical protein
MKILFFTALVLFLVSLSNGQINGGGMATEICAPDVPYRCPDSSCCATVSNCTANPCNGTTPFLCSNGTCAISAIYCNCQGVVCWDGSCKSDIKTCPRYPGCPELYPRRCPDGSCDVWSSNCTERPTPVCPTGLALCIDGICRPSTVCRNLPYAGCSKYICGDGVCVQNYSVCLCTNDLSLIRCYGGGCTPLGTKCPLPAPQFDLVMNITVTLNVTVGANIGVPSAANSGQNIAEINLPSNSVGSFNGTTLNTLTVGSVGTSDTSGSQVLDTNGTQYLANVVSPGISVNFGTGQRNLSSDVTLTFLNVPSGVDPNSLCVAVLIDGIWYCSNYTTYVSHVNGTLTVSSNVSHFSTYAVIQKPPYPCRAKCVDVPCTDEYYDLKTTTNEVLGSVYIKNHHDVDIQFEAFAFEDIGDSNFGWKMTKIEVELGAVSQSIEYVPGQGKAQEVTRIQLSQAFADQPSKCAQYVKFKFTVHFIEDGPCNVTTGCNTFVAYAVPHTTFQKRFNSSPPVAPYFYNYTVCCNCNYVTYRPNEFARSCSSLPIGCYEDNNFDMAFPVGMQLGCSAGKTISLTTPSSVRNYLDQYNTQFGTPRVLTVDHINPTSTEAGSLGGELAALILSDGFDRVDSEWQDSCNYIRNLFVCAPYAGDCNTFHNKTVGSIMEKGQKVLGGCETGNIKVLSKCLQWITTSLQGGKRKEQFENRGLNIGVC